MAETSGARDGAFESGDPSSLLPGWRDIAPGEGLAGEWPGAREAAQKHWPLRPAVPGLPRHRTSRADTRRAAGVDVARSVRERAFEKADSRGGHSAAKWDVHIQAYVVGSNDTPGTNRIVRKRVGAYSGDPWWVRLSCDCPNETTGRQVCWHKAAVVRLWEHQQILREVARLTGKDYRDDA
jgi:hypothetical protein